MRAFLVAGLAFGDEGKGTMVDHLCRYHNANLVVRYNGGPQAGHNVVLRDGRHHTFSQFGSGTFIPGCRTYISEHMLIEPFAMMNEANELFNKAVPDALDRLTINPNAVIITPWHWKANRIRELSRGTRRHGSCGMGVGEARMDKIESDLAYRVSYVSNSLFIDTLKKIKELKLNQCKPLVNCSKSEEIYKSMQDTDPRKVHLYYSMDWFPKVGIGNWNNVINRPNVHKDTVVFEGAQGVLLDETFGFGEHVTWTNCTFDNAFHVMSRSNIPIKVIKIGVVRSYYTRHGAGPFVTECKSGSVNGIITTKDPNNPHNDWQGQLRVGYFDMLALKYALNVVSGVDYLAVTHMDSVDPDKWRYCDEYILYDARLDSLQIETMELFQDISHTLVRSKSVKSMLEFKTGVQVGYESYGPTFEDKTESAEVEDNENDAYEAYKT